MKYPLTSVTWDQQEVDAIQSVVASGRYTMGDRVAEFERDFAKYFGAKFAVMVNSGSSANLIAVAALRYCRENSLKPGDEVLVPAVSWSTTYFQQYQYGLSLRFVDINPNTLNPDVERFEAAITPRTKAIFAVNVLGCPNDFANLTALCRSRNLILLEDNCESMGARFGGKYTGTFGLCGTFSTFFSHHICTMEGGVILTDSEEFCQVSKSLRAHGWLRELPPENLVYPKGDNEWDNLFRFVLPGYNVRPLEMSGAIGVQQLKKLERILAIRRANAQVFTELFANLSYLRIQQPLGESSWFGFSMVLRGELASRRDAILRLLQQNGIESRPIIAGNFCNSPAIRFLDYSTAGVLTHADEIDVNGLFVGNSASDLTNELKFLREILDSYVRTGIR
jgi:CDP-6-deoxy-D-xylo-4-hexulose-3-dehydrase